MGRQFWQRKYWAALLLLVVLLGVIGATAGRHSLSGAAALAARVFSFAQKPVETAGNTLHGFVVSLGEIRNLRVENEELRRELAALTGKYTDLVEREIENQRLRELLDFKKGNPFDTVTAQVIGRSTSHWFSTATLNRGTGDGVQKDMVVVTGKGLVGKIISTTVDTAVVLLFVDPDCGVGAYIQRTRDYGVVLGQVGTSGSVDMRLFVQECGVSVGDVVLTSGLGDVFPPELPVGVVTAVGKGEYGLTTYAKVAPYVDFDRLEDVLIIVGTEVTAIE
ncbi:MAG: rod shape-determining protein MreC [bacterium]